MTTDLPKTYKAIQVETKGGPFNIVDRELKLPSDMELLVRTEACGICHTDSLGVDAVFPVAYPLVPGHEVVGRVVAVGKQVTEFKVGERVGVGYEGGHCQKCYACRKAAFQCCDNQTITGIFRDGGYAEYVLIQHESAVRVPEDLDAAEVAPLLCAGVTVYNSMRNMPLMAGEIVAVQGIGGLGHLALQFARKMGFRVVALSTSDEKKELAFKLGAHEYIGTKDVQKQVEVLKKLGGAKVILCTAPHADSVGPLVDGLALDGIILVVAAAGPVTVDTNAMIPKRAALRAWLTGTALDAEETIKFAQMVDVKCKVERFQMEDVEKAYEKMMTNKARFRSVLVFGDGK